MKRLITKYRAWRKARAEARFFRELSKITCAVAVGLTLGGCCSRAPEVAEEKRSPQVHKLWCQLYTAHFNIRYREIAGDDGLKAEWQDLEKKYLTLWYGKESDLTDDTLDALYLERVAIEHREQVPDVKALNQAEAESYAEVESRAWPLGESEWRASQKAN